MNVSLNQAIDIHAKALKHRSGNRAPHVARDKARHCAASGDNDGQTVWLKVAASAETLLADGKAQLLTAETLAGPLSSTWRRNTDTGFC
jgi:hypothetical protein